MASRSLEDIPGGVLFHTLVTVGPLSASLTLVQWPVFHWLLLGVRTCSMHRVVPHLQV